MKKIIYLTLLLLPGLHLPGFAQPFVLKYIDINNIKAVLPPSSDMFWDFSNPFFEVPKGSNKHTIFAGALWIGGLDSLGNIHLAAQTYRQTGNDFWPGPIDTTAPGGTEATDYMNYLESWKIHQWEIDDHILNYSTTGYVVPPAIASWPGFDTTVNRVTAPFADYNGNGIYDPQNGDYPYILGEQSVYSIFNDWYPHTETSCDYLGVEVHREFFGFDAPANTPLDNSIFARYYVKNFSNNDYHDVYITMWTDFDLGNAVDDFVGTDMNLEMIYVYNGDPDDEGMTGYGLNPPAMGAYFLNHPLAASVFYNNINNTPTGNPGFCDQYYNYMKGQYSDSLLITYGGIGTIPGYPVTTFMYPGITDSINYPLYGEWSEITAGNIPEDRRIMGSIGPFNLNSMDVITFDVGYTYARADSGGPLASVAVLQDAVNSLRVLYNSGGLTSIPTLEPVAYNPISVYPNPATERVTIKNSSPGKPYTVMIQDATGRIVYIRDHLDQDLHEVNTNNYQKGIYLITVMQQQKKYSRKLVVK